MGNVEGVKLKVQQYLTESFSNVTIDRDGDFSLQNGSARIFVRVTTRNADAPTIVGLTIPLLIGVQDGPELHKAIAFRADDYIFGHLSLHRWDTGEVGVFLTHQLLGDYLDAEELGRAVAGMLSVADDLDDELQTQFGGKRFHEGD